MITVDRPVDTWIEHFYSGLGKIIEFISPYGDQLVVPADTGDKSFRHLISKNSGKIIIQY